ncbi:glycosyltransferase family 39 protein [Humibacillus xanthopallidus]|nr:glycosyltransferase family 39 protein [Humibacillus xanthopallidus]
MDVARPRLPRLEVVLAWCAALAVAGLYLADAAAHGALGAARNDDWVYYRLAFSLASTGHLSFDPYSSTLLVGQVVAAQPVIAVFGAQIAPLQVAVALLSAVALAAAYFFFRHFLAAFWAAFCVALIAVGPIWGGLSVSFMSDVPAIALQVLCLCAAVPALRGPRLRWGWLALSLVLALLAFSVREYSLAAAAAVLIAALLTHGRRPTGRLRLLLVVAGVGIVWVLLAAALFLWRDTLVAGPRALTAEIELGQRVYYVLAGILTTTGFLMFPVALAVWRGGMWRMLLRWWPLTVALIALFTYTSHVLGYPLLVGNYVRLGGSYSGTLAGVAPAVFSRQAWWSIMAAANVATSLLITFAVARTVSVLLDWRRRRREVTEVDTHSAEAPATAVRSIDPSPRIALTFGVVTVALVVVVVIITRGRPFDRYVVGAVPFLAAAAIHASRSKAPQLLGRLVASAAVAVLALIGVAQVDASATFDGTKWSLGTEATRLGYAAETVDAGYEWFGFHQPGPVIYDYRREPGYPSYVTSLFTDARVCVLGEFAPRPTQREPYAREVVRVSRVSLIGPRYTLIGRSADRNCPSS